MNRNVVTIAVLTALAIAGCSSDEPASEFGEGQSTSTVAATVSTEPTSSQPTSAATPVPDTKPETAVTTAVTAGPLPEPDVALYEVGDFDQPVDVTYRPGDSLLYVVEQPGRIVAVTDLSTEVVLDITDLTEAGSEQGLLGLAFHPTADLAYVHFTDNDGDSVVAEFEIDPVTGILDPASEREVLTVDQPYSNHNGGQLAFGPDGWLYIGFGDGGSGGDPERHAVDLTSRLGKILRIDPVAAGDQPFSVPDDNPFSDDSSADPTVWSYGLRNPWKFSFDADTGDLWIADVGQGDFEEINHSPATDRRDAGRALDYGWSALEGFEPFNDDQPTDGVTAPLFVYDHGDGRCSVSGGTVARGTTVPDLVGWYVFGDYCSGQIWALDPTAPADQPRVVEIAQLDGLAAISEGPDRELYAVSNNGTIARFIPG